MMGLSKMPSLMTEFNFQNPSGTDSIQQTIFRPLHVHSVHLLSPNKQVSKQTNKHNIVDGVLWQL